MAPDTVTRRMPTISLLSARRSIPPKRFDIGVLFRAVGGTDNTNEGFMRQKHWVIVIKSDNVHRTIDLLTDGKEIFVRESSSPPVDIDLVASYTGEDSDFDEVLKQHPMRHSQYSPCFNNCQHFAAIFLILLHAYSYAHPDRSFNPQPRYTTITSSVMVGDGHNLWNKPNWYMQMAHALTVQTAAFAGGVATAAAKARRTARVAGILGWLGATTTAPAWFSAAAATAAPVCIGATAVLGGEYFRRSYVWKMASKFPDPRVYGFPTTNREPLSPKERLAEEVAQSMAVDKSGVIASLAVGYASNVPSDLPSDLPSNVPPQLSFAVPKLPLPYALGNTLGNTLGNDLGNGAAP